MPQRSASERDLVGARLAIVRGPRRGTLLPLVVSPMLIGRLDSNHIVVDDPSVSRVHARLVLGKQGVLVEDLDSAGGTFVNGRRLDPSAMLSDGDELRVGVCVFVLTLPEQY